MNKKFLLITLLFAINIAFPTETNACVVSLPPGVNELQQQVCQESVDISVEYINSADGVYHVSGGAQTSGYFTICAGGPPYAESDTRCVVRQYFDGQGGDWNSSASVSDSTPGNWDYADLFTLKHAGATVSQQTGTLSISTVPTTPPPPACGIDDDGNGNLEDPGEECDLGVLNGQCQTTCSTSCTLNICSDPPAQDPSSPVYVVPTPSTITVGQRITLYAYQDGVPTNSAASNSWGVRNVLDPMNKECNSDPSDDPDNCPIARILYAAGWGVVLEGVAPGDVYVGCQAGVLCSPEADLKVEPAPVIVDIKARLTGSGNFYSDGPIYVNSGSDVDLSWVTTGYLGQFCSGSGSWAGNGRPPTGSITRFNLTTPPNQYIYTLTCGTGFDSVVVNVDSPFAYSLNNTPTIYATLGGGNVYTQNVINKVLTTGVSEPVTLALTSTLPSGISYSISNNPCSPNCSSVMLFTVSPSASAGIVPVTLTGSPNNVPTSFDLNISGSSMTVSCSASPSPALMGQAVIWTANVTSGGTAPFMYQWSGTNIPPSLPSSPDPSLNISYGTIGNKIANVVVTDANDVESTCQSNIYINFDPQLEEF